MLNFISEAISKIGSLLNKLPTKRFVSLVLLGFLFLTTNVDQRTGNPVSDLYDKIVHQDNSQNDSQRPKTMGEWNKQDRETKGDPGERIKRIGEQSIDAVKDLGAVYPNTAKRSAASLQNDRNK